MFLGWTIQIQKIAILQRITNSGWWRGKAPLLRLKSIYLGMLFLNWASDLSSYRFLRLEQMPEFFSTSLATSKTIQLACSFPLSPQSFWPFSYWSSWSLEFSVSQGTSQLNSILLIFLCTQDSLRFICRTVEVFFLALLVLLIDLGRCCLSLLS